MTVMTFSPWEEIPTPALVSERVIDIAHSDGSVIEWCEDCATWTATDGGIAICHN